MPARHQNHSERGGARDGHPGHSATDRRTVSQPGQICAHGERNPRRLGHSWDDSISHVARADDDARAGSSASTSTCRSARRGAATATSTPTRRPSWVGPTRTAGWPRCGSSSSWPPRLLPAPPVDTVFVGGGTPSLLGGDGLAAVLDAVRDALHAGPRRRGDHRGQPGVDVAGVLRADSGGRLHPGVAGHAVGGAGRAARCSTACIRRAVRSPRRARRWPPASSTSTSTSSTARRGSPTTTCAARWTPRRTPGSTTCRRTRWSSRTAPRWPGGCVAARCAASDDDVLARRYELLDGWLSDGRAAAGTRCRTGVGPAASAGTTSATGTAASGGAPGRVRTASSGRRDGGMSSTPTPMRSSWPSGRFRSAGFEELDVDDRHTEDVLLGIRLSDGLALSVLSDDERARAEVDRRRGFAASGRRAAGADRSRPPARRRRGAGRADRLTCRGGLSGPLVPSRRRKVRLHLLGATVAMSARTDRDHWHRLQVGRQYHHPGGASGRSCSTAVMP